MARGHVSSFRTSVGLRWRAYVDSQGVKVWSDDGWPSLSDAIDSTRPVVHAFTVTDGLGQTHRPWSAIVDEVSFE